MRRFECLACGDPVPDRRQAIDPLSSVDYCDECHDELYAGKIAPAYGPIIDDDDAADDDLTEDGCIDNAIKAMEDTR